MVIYITYFNDEVPQYCELKINNNTIAVPDSSDWDYNYWYVDSTHAYVYYGFGVYSGDIPELGNIYEGQDLDYYIKINNTTNTGSLEIPYQPYGTFPDFDLEENYTFDWTIQKSPDLHYIYFEIWDWDYETGVYKNLQQSGSIREYTISKSLYQHLEGFDEFYCDIDAINYHRNGSFLAMSSKYDSYEEGWKSENPFDRELHRKRLIKALLNDLRSE